MPLSTFLILLFCIIAAAVTTVFALTQAFGAAALSGTALAVMVITVILRRSA